MLEPIKNNFNVVVVGRWNVAIFSPQWVGKNIVGEEDVVLDIGIEPILSRRITVKDIVIIPTNSRLIVTVNNLENDKLKEMEKATCKILEILKYTPVSAVGINFGYKIKPITEELQTKFPVLLATELASEELRITSREYKWITDYENEKDKNLNFTLAVNGEEATLTFNFSSIVENTEKAILNINDKVIPYKEKALSIINNAFGISTENENG